MPKRKKNSEDSYKDFERPPSGYTKLTPEEARQLAQDAAARKYLPRDQKKATALFQQFKRAFKENPVFRILATNWVNEEKVKQRASVPPPKPRRDVDPPPMPARDYAPPVPPRDVPPAMPARDIDAPHSYKDFKRTGLPAGHTKLTKEEASQLAEQAAARKYEHPNPKKAESLVRRVAAFRTEEAQQRRKEPTPPTHPGRPSKHKI